MRQKPRFVGDRQTLQGVIIASAAEFWYELNSTSGQRRVSIRANPAELCDREILIKDRLGRGPRLRHDGTQLFSRFQQCCENGSARGL